MTRHNDSVYLTHMLDTSHLALKVTSGKTYTDLTEDLLLQYAVVHALQIVGEAARQLSTQTKAQMSEIPWHKIVGMRHRIVHDYFAIDTELVWDTITNDLTPLIEAINRSLPHEEN